VMIFYENRYLLVKNTSSRRGRPESLDATDEGLNPANTLNPVYDISVIKRITTSFFRLKLYLCTNCAIVRIDWNVRPYYEVRPPGQFRP
jgi:hypothetical protein